LFGIISVSEKAVTSALESHYGTIFGDRVTPHFLLRRWMQVLVMQQFQQQANTSTLLKEAFGKSEIAYLIEQPKFRSALATHLLSDDFRGLHQTALDLLSRRPSNAGSIGLASPTVSPMQNRIV
jgi:hypothetical protein